EADRTHTSPGLRRYTVASRPSSEHSAIRNTPLSTSSTPAHSESAERTICPSSYSARRTWRARRSLCSSVIRPQKASFSNPVCLILSSSDVSAAGKGCCGGPKPVCSTLCLSFPLEFFLREIHSRHLILG